jgi:general secretion pathway protein M
MRIVDTVAAMWRARAPREQTVLLTAAALVLAAALYLLLWEPGMAARKRLSASLPQMRAQLEDMRRQRSEIASVRKQIAAVPRQGDLVTLLRASAAQTPFTGAVERIEALPDGKVRMQSAAVPFTAWLAWIESLQRQLGVRVTSCRISALEQPGLVRLDATFIGAGAPSGAGAP